MKQARRRSARRKGENIGYKKKRRTQDRRTLKDRKTDRKKNGKVDHLE
jgi:hypothetical protein